MAVVSGTVHTVDTLMADAVSAVQLARIKFTVAGTYAQADNGQLVGIPTLIQNARRNGKTVTLRGAMLGAPATKNSDPNLLMALKTVAVSSADVTFEITEGATAGVVDYSTELAAGAVPAQARPFELIVAFSEA